MNEAGFDVTPVEMDLSSRSSIKALIAEGQKYGEIKMLVNAAGVSPSQAPIEAILKVDLYGTAVLLEEVGRVIAPGGVGVTISNQSCWRMPALTAEQGEKLATTPTEELLSLDFLQPENIRDTLHAYQMAKRCNEKRVTAQAVEWGKRGARLNDIAPGIIVTPLALDEFNGPRGDFYKNMFAKCPAGRPGAADEAANVAELLMSDKGAFITGSTFLIDGGATASYFYGPLRPEKGMIFPPLSQKSGRVAGAFRWLCRFFYSNPLLAFCLDRLHTEEEVDEVAEPHNSENSAENVKRFSQHQEKADGHQQRHGHQDAGLGLRGHARFLHE